MTPPPRNPHTAWIPRDLETPAPKLDPRLRYLLSLPFADLKQLQLREWNALQLLQEKIRIEFEALGATQDPAEQVERRRRLRRLYGERFTPLTSGLHIPDPVAGTGMWAIGIDEVYFSAFILTDTNSVGLQRHGVRVRCQSGDVFTAFVPGSSIAGLETLAAVRGIELARPLFASLDWTIPFTHIDDLHALPPPPIDGSGVIVGVVDNGIDFRHPGFLKPGTGFESRLLFLWDQNAILRANESKVAGDVPLPGFAISDVEDSGVEYPAKSGIAGRHTINGALLVPVTAATPANSIVSHTAWANAKIHGTQVTGCAAGNGAKSGGTCVGAAPGADIIFVAYKEEAGSAMLAENTAVMDACNYIFLRARQLLQPCVINLSLNDNLGPHDGTSACERFLDGLLGGEPGRAVTVSAGNSNDKKAHAEGTVGTAHPGNVVTLVLRYDPAFAHQSDQVQIWYTGGSSLVVSVDVAGVTRISSLVPTAVGNPAEATLPGGARLIATSTLDCEWNHDNMISLLIKVDPGSSIDELTIILKNTSTSVATFHAWVDRNNENASEWVPFVNDTGTLGSPATAKFVIAVGSHHKTDPPAVPTITPYSGCGPTRAVFGVPGRQKPEIATAGGFYQEATAIAPLIDERMHVPFPHDPSIAAPTTSQLYWYDEGTSFSAPVVAGACALLFPCRGGTGGAMDLLQDLADSAGAAGPVNAFGNGYLQMTTACSSTGITLLSIGLDENDLESEIEGLPATSPPLDDTWWGSPDIRLIIDERYFMENPIPLPPTPADHRVQVTVRNTSRQEFRNVEVEFYWAKLATGLTSLADWSKSGVSVPSKRGTAVSKNQIVLERVPPRSETRVEFLWKPPAGGGGPRATASFSLLARISHPSMVARRRAGGRLGIGVGVGEAVALRSVVVGKLGASRKGSMDFLVAGSENPSSLRVGARGVQGEVTLRLRIEALPWRDLAVLESSGIRRARYGTRGVPDPLARTKKTLVGEDISLVTGVLGAEKLTLAGGFATLVAKVGRSLELPDVRVAPGARLPVRVEIRNAKLGGRRGFVHVVHTAEGRAAGGVTLELRQAASRRGRGG